MGIAFDILCIIVGIFVFSIIAICSFIIGARHGRKDAENKNLDRVAADAGMSADTVRLMMNNKLLEDLMKPYGEKKWKKIVRVIFGL